MQGENCFQQAVMKLQKVFPSINLNVGEVRVGGLENMLDMLMKQLPVPEENLSQTIVTMRQIIDEQQYRFQRSLLNEEFILEECFYEDGSTGLDRKQSGFTCGQLEDVWSWRASSPKEEYFSFLD